MRRNELPDFCLSTLPSSGQLIILRKGERGYYASEWDTGKREENQNIAREHNRRRGISDIQEAAMSAGSMFGWNLPGADPQWYLDNARYVNATTAKGHIKDPVMSIYYPVDDFLLQYEILGEAKMYLPIPSCFSVAATSPHHWNLCRSCWERKRCIPAHAGRRRDAAGQAL